MKKAMAERHLTPHEQEEQEENQALADDEEAHLESSKQWNNLQVMAAILVGLVLLIVTIKIVKGKGDADVIDE